MQMFVIGHLKQLLSNTNKTFTGTMLELPKNSRFHDMLG